MCFKVAPYQLQILLLVLSYAFPASFGLMPWYILWSPLLSAIIAGVLENIAGIKPAAKTATPNVTLH
jgi:hypothetical protein